MRVGARVLGAVLTAGVLLVPASAFASSGGSATAPTQSTPSGSPALSNYEAGLTGYKATLAQWRSSGYGAGSSYQATLKAYRTMLSAYNAALRQIDATFSQDVASINSRYKAATTGQTTVLAKEDALESRYVAVAAATTTRGSAVAALGTPPERPVLPSVAPSPVVTAQPGSTPIGATPTTYQSAVAAHKAALAQWSADKSARRASYLAALKVYNAAVAARHSSVRKLNATYRSAVVAATRSYTAAVAGKPTAAQLQMTLLARAKANAAAKATRIAAVAALPVLPVRPLAPVVAPKPAAPLKP